MQDNNVLVTDHRYAATARFWRESLSRVAGVYGIAAYAPSQQPGRQLSRSVRLTPASLDLLRRIGDGELAETAKGWGLRVAGEVAVTEAPAREELGALRELVAR